MDTSRLSLSETFTSVNIAANSGVAWAAILGGALAAAGLTFVLFPLGAGLGLGWMPSWNDGEFSRHFTVASAIWLIVVQWITAGFGGYLTGRLRTKWSGAHTHEVFFRDTVHGFLAWALAAVLGVFLVALAAPESPAHSSAVDYALFRSASETTPPSDMEREESSRIITAGALEGRIPDPDRAYLTEIVTGHTGISAIEADTRINEAIVRQKDTLRNAGRTAFFTALSFLIGAFVAAAAGALGGLHRDVHYEHGRLSL